MGEVMFDEVVEQALQLQPAEQAKLMERLATSMRELLDIGSDHLTSDEAQWTEDEVKTLMTIEPLSPADVVAQDLLGSWANMGISDGADWVNMQKQKRKARRKW